MEDHEDILAVHRELEMFASGHERRFYFSEDFLKYELFVNPKVSQKKSVTDESSLSRRSSSFGSFTRATSINIFAKNTLKFPVFSPSTTAVLPPQIKPFVFATNLRAVIYRRRSLPLGCDTLRRYNDVVAHAVRDGRIPGEILASKSLLYRRSMRG